MTKKQLVEEIRLAEAKAWKEYQESKALWGKDDAITVRCQAKWMALFDLREALGVDPMPIDQLIAEDLVPAAVAI